MNPAYSAVRCEAMFHGSMKRWRRGMAKHVEREGDGRLEGPPGHVPAPGRRNDPVPDGCPAVLDLAQPQSQGAQTLVRARRVSDDERVAMPVEGQPLLSLDEGAPVVVAVRRGDRGDGGNVGILGGCTDEWKVREVERSEQHGPLRSSGTTNGASNVERSKASPEGKVARHEVMARIEVSLGLRQPAEPAVAPSHLDVTRHLVELPRRTFAHRGQPAHPWLPTLLGKDLEPNQAEELLPVPRRRDAEAQGPGHAGTQDEVRGTAHPQEPPQHGLSGAGADREGTATGQTEAWATSSESAR